MPALPRLFIGLTILLTVGRAACVTESPAPTRAVDRARLDTTCAPCQDFYRFANGTWLDATVIPPDQERWGPLAELQQRNSAPVSQLLDSLAYAPERHARNTVERKIGGFFQACMDPGAHGDAALRSLMAELDRIEAIGTPADLGPVIGWLSRHRARVLINVAQAPDEQERIGVVAFAFFNAFSFPSLYQYLGADSASVLVRDTFVAALSRDRTGPESSAERGMREPDKSASC